MEIGTSPIKADPYKNMEIFKDKIEKTIKELIDLGFIRTNSSPFASSIVLVKKKEKNMCMCIDYIALNKNTIKNRYHIPMIDELID